MKTATVMANDGRGWSKIATYSYGVAQEVIKDNGYKQHLMCCGFGENVSACVIDDVTGEVIAEL